MENRHVALIGIWAIFYDYLTYIVQASFISEDLPWDFGEFVAPIIGLAAYSLHANISISPIRTKGRFISLTQYRFNIAALLLSVSGYCLPAMASIPVDDVTAFADVTGDGVPDVASVADNGTGRPGIAIHSGATGALHTTFDYINDRWRGLNLASARDADQDGAADDPAVSMLAVNKTTGKIRVESRHLGTGALLSSILFFNANWRPVDIVIVDDLKRRWHYKRYGSCGTGRTLFRWPDSTAITRSYQWRANLQCRVP